MIYSNILDTLIIVIYIIYLYIHPPKYNMIKTQTELCLVSRITVVASSVVDEQQDAIKFGSKSMIFLAV